MNDKISRNVDKTNTEENLTINNLCKNNIFQSYSKTSITDVICDQISDINVLTNISDQCLNFERLYLLSESKPEYVFSLLTNDNFKNILKACVNISTLIDLMNLFSNLNLLKSSQIKTNVLNMIYNSKYFENVNNSVKNNRYEDLISKIKLNTFLASCQTVLKIIIDPKAKIILNGIILSLDNNYVGNKELKLNNDNLEIVEVVQMLKNLKITNRIQYDIKKCSENYKSISVYPVTKDIFSKKVILSPNITKGRYENVEHYIDVHFRLLHEDFIAPIREGIQCYKAMNEVNPNFRKLPNMKIYFKTKIEKVIKNGKTLYSVHFYTREDCSIDSKRFMHESLLIFSDDNFSSMFFAIVIRINRQIFLPTKTLVIQPLDNHVTIKLNSFYTMAESETYFLPYKYTMEVLKTFNYDNFPMKSYIVYGKIKPKIPAYLTYFSKMYNINGFQFNILNDNFWPDHTFLKLDYAQSKAFKAALTKEFTVIQGPPGTGKTYIGLRIARSIIENMYETNILKNPILVICYTNHALDQFLEGLIKITKNITRIGGGCKSDVLKSYVLGNIQTPSAQTRLKSSYVVGLTTTGASTRRSLVLKLKPPIVIVEEAAEVLESHVVASLTEFCQHVILIGDHKQLRPRTASYTLLKELHFDISLFERLVTNGFPCYTLTTQHRMCPEISALIQPIYPFLKDHETVKSKSNIRGLKKNIYFIHHENHEEKVIHSNSFKNIHEVNFFMEFIRYLFYQGYHQNQITILVTYKDQLLELQKIREKSWMLEDFRIECVDGYQGEENDIILLSLVRNNMDNNLGFLSIQNRICVALSRARNGLYIMGNMDNLIHSSIWKEISLKLVNQQSLGKKLTLCCEIHKDWTATVCDSKDFIKARCFKVCNMKMDCGHLCKELCHYYYDQRHKYLYRCTKHYIKTLSCGLKIKIECWMRFLNFECPK